MKDIKKEMIEKSAEDFQKLNEDSKMFILGYMVGIQQERLKQNPDDKIKGFSAGKKCAWKNKFITEFGISRRLD